MSESQNAINGWMTAGIATIIATLSSAVAWLFKLRENENSKRIEELKTEVQTIRIKADKCEEERGDLKTECAILRSKIDSLETKMQRIDLNGNEFSHQALTKDKSK